jgi:hypothetical protein
MGHRSKAVCIKDLTFGQFLTVATSVGKELLVSVT